MAELKIVTNNHWRQLKYRHEVPEKVLQGQFDWTNEDDHCDGFFQYRGTWYHSSEFLSLSQGAPREMKEWHGYSSDSFFSGVLIRISEDGEMYQVATYIG